MTVNSRTPRWIHTPHRCDSETASAAGLEPKWQIRLLGGLHVRYLNLTCDDFRTEKNAALLGYLAYHLGHSSNRDVAGGHVWPDTDDRTARRRLNTAIWELGRLLIAPGAPSLLVAGRCTLRLDSSVVCTDVDEFRSAVRNARSADCSAVKVQGLKYASDLYTGELLSGLCGEWITLERQRLSETHFELLVELLRLETSHGELAGAIDIALRMIAARPLAEESHQELLRLYLASGRTADAVSHFREIEGYIGRSPSKETRRLVEQRIGRSSGGRTGGRRLETPAYDENRATLRRPLAPFFGREREIAQIIDRFEKGDRLITLTGPGGSGKTRLAVEAADRQLKALRGRAWLVALSDVTDAGAIPGRIAAALNLGLQGEYGVEGDPLSRLREALSAAPSLLVLDSFERVGTGGVELLLDLLEAVPKLRCLVTSLEGLDAPGGDEIRVQPLPLPDRTIDLEELTGCASVQLFVDRARRTQSTFELTVENAAAVGDLCRRLEGIPLAIELAAGWAQILAPAQMLEKLEDRFRLLVSRKRSLESRHSSLRAAIDASYELLSPDLQQLFAELSVFRGGWTLEAAESVLGAGFEALDRLGPLVSSDEQHGRMRFRMLDALREYAATRMSADRYGELSRRHAEHFLQVAERAESELNGQRQAEWLDRLEDDHDNLRAALRWQAAARPESAVLMAESVWRFWYLRGHFQEGISALNVVIESPEMCNPALCARALNIAGVLARAHGDVGDAERYFTESEITARQAGDRATAVGALGNLALLAYDRGDLDDAREKCAATLIQYQEMNEDQLCAATLINLGAIAMRQGDRSSARMYLEESLSLHNTLGDRWSAALVLQNLGEIASQEGDYSRTVSMLENSIAIGWELRAASHVATAATTLGGAAIDSGQTLRGVRLIAGADAVRRDTESSLSQVDRAIVDRRLRSARRSLGREAFTTAWKEGSSMDVEDLVEYAVGRDESADAGRGRVTRLAS